MARPLKVLLFDIETTPRVTYSWRPDDRFHPHQFTIRESYMLSWAAKWRDDKKLMGDVLTTHEAREGDDERLLRSLYDVMVEAEVVVAHNIQRFDWPRFNGFILEHGLDPIYPPTQIDTKKWAEQFGFPYRNLDYLAERAGLGSKIKTEFELWERCMRGESKALKQMLKYNKHDVRLLEGVFEWMLPYVKGAPKLWVGTDAAKDDYCCPFCGHTELQKRGFRDTKAARYQQVQCQNCRKYSSYPTYHRSSRLVLRPN